MTTKKNGGFTFMEIADNTEIVTDDDAGKALRHLRDIITERKSIELVHDKGIKDKFAEHKEAKNKFNKHVQPWAEAEETLRDKVNVWLTYQGHLAEEAAERGDVVSSLIPEDISYANADGFFNTEIHNPEAFIRWAVKAERFDLLKIDNGKVNKLAKDTGGMISIGGTTIEKRYRVKVTT